MRPFSMFPAIAGAIGADGHFIKAVYLDFADAEAAIESTKQLLDGRDLELWQRERLIIRLSIVQLDERDGDNNGTIEVTELAAFLYAQVTASSERVFKQWQEPQITITLNYPLIKQGHVLFGRHSAGRQAHETGVSAGADRATLDQAVAARRSSAAFRRRS